MLESITLVSEVLNLQLVAESASGTVSFLKSCSNHQNFSSTKLSLSKSKGDSLPCSWEYEVIYPWFLRLFSLTFLLIRFSMLMFSTHLPASGVSTIHCTSLIFSLLLMSFLNSWSCLGATTYVFSSWTSIRLNEFDERPWESVFFFLLYLTGHVLCCFAPRGNFITLVWAAPGLL